jgi:predicted membrane-bound spermidine synthase
MNPGRLFLFTLAFLEGASVMACELFGAKMVAPFFGSSLYVWAAVLGVTLFALMSGYYLGGFLSSRSKKDNLVYWILLFAGVLLVVMPYTSELIMTNTIEMSVQMGSTLSLLIFMFPPLLLMGMTSPIIINMVNTKLDLTGKSAGSVYAISTLGGIFATFLVGFYLLPEFGIKWPCFFFGILLAALPLFALVRKRIFMAAVFLMPVVFIAYANSSNAARPDSEIKIIYEAEGMLGQLKVVDMPYPTHMRGVKPGRALMINSTIQTILDLENPEYDLWDWSRFFPTTLSIYPEGSDVLLLGLGGGTLVQQFKRLNFNVDVVELDQRIKEVAIEYFFIDPATNIVVDDARHYINTCKKKYDIVTIDLFLNETPPVHVLTVESFTKIKEMLNPGGMVMMNFYGHVTGEKGWASRCILKTFETAGFQVELLATPGNEAHRNLFFLASPEPNDYTKTDYVEPLTEPIGDITKHFLYKSTLNMEDAMVLTDDCPALEKIYLPAALEWRKNTIDYNLQILLEEKIRVIR